MSNSSSRHRDARKRLETVLTATQVHFVSLPPEEVNAVRQQWVNAFLNGQVPAYRSDHDRACWFDALIGEHRRDLLFGEQARHAYAVQFPAEFVIFLDVENAGAYRCRGPYPDCASLGDIYLAHHHMKWTMVWTHEPDASPLFLKKAGPKY